MRSHSKRKQTTSGASVVVTAANPQAAITHHRLALNNHIQETLGKQNLVVWNQDQITVKNKRKWEAVASIHGSECGRATADTLDQAKEEAARLALIRLTT